jgi:hypothetical protein
LEDRLPENRLLEERLPEDRLQWLAERPLHMTQLEDWLVLVVLVLEMLQPEDWLVLLVLVLLQTIGGDPGMQWRESCVCLFVSSVFIC